MNHKIDNALNDLKASCAQALFAVVQQWHDFLSYEQHASAHTIYNYVLDLKSFLGFLSQHLGHCADLDDLSTATLTQFRAFLAYRINQGSSARSNKRCVSTLRHFYGFLQQRHHVSNQHLAELTSPRAEKTLPRPMSLHQTQHLQDLSQLYAHQPKWLQARDEALFMLLYGCGLRITEALNLNVADINTHSLRILGKRNKERMIPMLGPVYNKIQAYTNSFPRPLAPDSPLFIGLKGDRLSPRVVQKQLEKIRLTLGLPESATPHALRHSYASHLLAGGADLRSIQELMGHDSLASTQVYTKLEDQELFETYMKAHPHSK